MDTMAGMTTATVRLNDEDSQMLDRLALEFGSKAGAIRHALRVLAADLDRRDAFNAFVEAWDAEAGPLDGEMVAKMARRYGL